MQDMVRAHIAAYLAGHQTCVIASGAGPGAHLVPAQYRSQGLAVECLLPRWADLSYLLEINPQVELVITGDQAGGWLEYRGLATVLSQVKLPWQMPKQTSWPQAVNSQSRFMLIRINPVRIDLIDPLQGFGARETLEFDLNEEKI